MNPGSRAAGEVAIVLGGSPCIAAQSARGRGTEKAPHHRACLRVQRQRRIAIGVGRAYVDQAIVVNHRDLPHIAVLGSRLHFPNHVAGVFVERDDVASACVSEDLPLTDRHTAACLHALARILPSGLSSRAVHGDHRTERRFNVDHAVDGDRRALVVACVDAAFDSIDPGATERANAARVDLGERRIVLIAEVSADLGKVVVAGRAAIGECRRRTRCDRNSRIRARDHSAAGEKRSYEYVLHGSSLLQATMRPHLTGRSRVRVDGECC